MTENKIAVPDSGRTLVMIVDDEPDIRQLVKEILEDEGFEVSTAENAEQAREARRARRPDLILLDIWMPDTDGITLLREWSDEGDLKCPVVIMSGHGTVDTAVEATRLGAHDFVEKPLSAFRPERVAPVAEAIRRQKPSRKSSSGTPKRLALYICGTSSTSASVRSLPKT